MTKKERAYIYRKLEWLYGMRAEAEEAIASTGNEGYLDVLESDKLATDTTIFHIQEILKASILPRPYCMDAARSLAEMEEAYAR